MTSDTRDDRWLERLLQRPGTTRGPDCLDAETLAAWTDGRLSAGDMTAVERHASGCAHCMSVLAAMARTSPEPVSARSWTMGPIVRWLVPLAASAAAVVLWVIVPRGPADSTVRQAPASASVPAPEASTRRSSIAQSPEAPPTQSDPAPPPARELELLRAMRESTTPATPLAQSGAAPPPAARADEVPQEQPRATDSARLSSLEGARLNAESAAPPPAPAAVAGASSETLPVAERPQGQRLGLVESSVSANRFVRWRIVGRRNIERSTDGGVNWSRTAVPDVVSAGTPDVTITNVLAIDAQTARVTTSTGSVFSTSDAGVTWVPVQEKPAAPF